MSESLKLEGGSKPEKMYVQKMSPQEGLGACSPGKGFKRAHSERLSVELFLTH